MIIVAGPYVGDFEQEILTFRPWVRWLYEISAYKKFYVHTHFNRLFMYRDFIEEKRHLIPIFENLSRDEFGQQEYIHNTLDSRDFNYLIRNVKELIMDYEDCSRKDIQVEYLNYAKYTPHMSIYKKLYSRITYPEDIWPYSEYKNKIVFIPYGPEKGLVKIKDFLKDYDSIIIGDKKCRFKDDNIVLDRVDYIENGFKTIIKIISEAKCVITPLSFWTTICNLQQVPVFSWGEQVGQHKPDGIYNFNNKYCWAMPITDINTITSMIKNFLGDSKWR